MDDICSTRNRHGHYPGKAFLWINHVLIDGQKMVIMVIFGVRIIEDKTCIRVGDETEEWFEPESTDREEIIK
jgi:hypothetical protein